MPSEEGYSVSTIAASVNLSEDLVREILDRAEEIKGGGVHSRCPDA